MIIDSDPVSRAAIQQALQAHDLSEHCVLVDCMQDDAQAKTTYFCVGGLPSGLEIKDSDHFTPPFRIGTLLDRVRRYTVDGGTSKAAPLVMGPYTLDPVNNVLTREEGEPIRLTDKESHMLSFLAARKGAFVDRRALLDEVWGYAENVETHTLETHIYRLRQKIEDDPANPSFLITEEQGYRLVF